MKKICYIIYYKIFWGCSSMARASALQAEC